MTDDALPTADASDASDVERPAGTGLKISVFGTGYLGATHAVAMAELGFEVLGADTDRAKVDALAAGKVPFYEPGSTRCWRSTSRPAGCGSPRTSTRPPRGATCTSSASAPRR